MDLVPQKFTDMPYAPFSKSDRLGRAADWSTYGSRYGRDGVLDESSAEFTIVDNKMVPRVSGYGRGRGRGGFRGRGGRGRFNDRFGDRRDARDSRTRGRGPAGRGGKGYRRWDDRRNIQRESSVQIGPEWSPVEEMTSSALSKLMHTEVPLGEDLTRCGSLPFYNRFIDRVSVKNARPLLVAPNGTTFPKVTTTDDPVIRRLAGANAGSVFATASILSTIMVAPRSVQSWDIVVQRIGGKLFLDKRDGTIADLVTVNETSHEAPKDEKNLPPEDQINSFQQLSLEATAINSNFAQMAVDKNTMFSYDEPNPFEEESDDPIAPAGYRYRKWSLSGDIVVVARCDLDGCTKPIREGEEPKPILIKALNEYFDPNLRTSTNWRSTLEAQSGAVLATEVYNNASKLARWTVEALLAGAEEMKFGFVSRAKRNDNKNHVLLATKVYHPREFAIQIALKTANMWGILKHIIELCFKHMQDGEKCVILKDPNKQIVRIYKVPDDAFESDDEEDVEEDEEDNTFV